VAAFAEGDVYITEVLQNPAGTDSNKEWFEVFNATFADIDLDGWTISDLGVDSHLISGSVVVPAGGYAVLGASTDPLLNGDTPVAYGYAGTVSLSNSDDELILTDPDGNLIDAIEWDNGNLWPDPNGASMNLGPSHDHIGNDDGAAWCETLGFPYGSDLSIGTPGSAGHGCAPAALPGDVVITEIMSNPLGDPDDDREWIEVVNVGSADLDLAGWMLADATGELATVSTSTPLLAGGTAVLGASADPVANGGVTVQYAYGAAFTLANDFDEVFLLEPGGVLIDAVQYDDGATFPDAEGWSMSLAPGDTDAYLNDDGFSWCEPPVPAYGPAGDAGTPGATNPVCVLGDDDDSVGDDDDSVGDDDDSVSP